jgi:hypothetical protein
MTGSKRIYVILDAGAVGAFPEPLSTPFTFL